MKGQPFLILLGFILTSCYPSNEKNDTTESHTSDTDRVINNSIDYAGGIQKWKSKGSLAFEKTSLLYLEDGSIEDSSIQKVSFSFNEGFKARISKKAEESESLLIFTNDSTKYIIGDSILEVNNAKHRSSIMSALFTIGMPFKLRDEGVLLTHKGKAEVEGREVEVIEANYNSETSANHSSDEIWWFYFDVLNSEFVGSKVYHHPTYALILNRSFTKVNGIKLPSHRQSYRVDSLGNIKFLRAEFFYKNFSMN